ncbi:MAG: phosphotransferase family protein [Mycobacteriales bacterium]
MLNLEELLGAEVADARWAPLGTGQMCDSLRVEVTWAGEPDLPGSFVVKLPAADPTSRATAAMMRSYEKEVRFYEQLAASLPVRTPRCWASRFDPETHDFALVLEDLAPAEPGDQLAGCSVEQAEAAVQQLVALHAPRWGDPALAELDWLVGDEAGSRALMTDLLPALWQGFTARYGTDVPGHVRTAGDLVFGRIEGYLAPRPGPRTVTHGDFRLDNLLLDGPAVTVVDWQTCALGHGAADVAYFVGAGLLTEVRREVEADLLQGWAKGVGATDVEEDYRRGTWAGLVMAVGASMMVQQTERGDRMFLTMAARHAQHALDSDADEVL